MPWGRVTMYLRGQDPARTMGGRGAPPKGAGPVSTALWEGAPEPRLGRGCARPKGTRSTCRAGLQLSLASPRATSNAWVRETAALELSYVNSSLQLLKEELEELNGSAEADRPEGCVCV